MPPGEGGCFFAEVGLGCPGLIGVILLVDIDFRNCSVSCGGVRRFGGPSVGWVGVDGALGAFVPKLAGLLNALDSRRPNAVV
jgi:hypothetical protein